MSGWRAFVAAEPAPDVLDRLRPAVESLAELPAVRVSAPNAIHLTLHFLGDVDPDRLDELADRMPPAVAPVAPFQVEVAGVGAFPSTQRPQVLYAGLEATGVDALGALRQLHASTGRAMAQVGLAPEARAFRPHLTLGRARRRLDQEETAQLRAWLRRWAGARFGNLPIDELALVRSELGGGPPRYTILRRFPLGDGKTAARRI